jgi:FkbM family methyltransferase
VTAVVVKRSEYYLAVVRSLVDRTIALFRLAENMTERLSVVRFMFKGFLCRLALRKSWRPQEGVLILNGCRYTVALRTAESSAFREILLDNVYERLDDFIPSPEWTVLDIGANIGVFSMRQARRGARVYAFEPNPECFRRLTSAIDANRLSDMITAFNCALGAVPGIGLLTVSTNTCTGSVMAVRPAGDVSRITVEVKSLDGVLASLGLKRIDLVKIDVEGAEVDVLQGASEVLAMVNRIVLEYHSEQLLEAVVAYLSGFGFKQRLLTCAKPNLGIVYLQRAPAHVGLKVAALA